MPPTVIAQEKILQKLVKSGKPFCLLLPGSVLHSAFLAETCDLRKVQSIMCRKVYPPPPQPSYGVSDVTFLILEGQFWATLSIKSANGQHQGQCGPHIGLIVSPLTVQ